MPADAKPPRRLAVRVLWFIGIWAVSIVVVAGVAEGLKKLILG
ncbi:hypothetical protein [Lichenicola sp.]